MIAAPRTATILIAEDDEDDRMLLADAFAGRDAGIEPVFVTDGEELIDYLVASEDADTADVFLHPDLILLDLNMPKMNGFEALHEIKGDPRFQEIPVVAFSTSSAETDISRSYALGVSSYIRKPSTVGQIEATIEMLEAYLMGLGELPARNCPES